MAKKARRIPVKIPAGVLPATDFSENGPPHWIDSYMVRWHNKKVQPIGLGSILDFPALYRGGSTGTLNGSPSLIFSYYDTTNIRTNTLLAGDGNAIIVADITTSGATPTVSVNITPVRTSTVAIANSLDTVYKTLANNPITTTSGSKTITIADSSTKIEAGDSITLSGCSGNPGGIPNAEINTTHTVVSAGANSFTVTVATTNASSSTSGGGASVVLATPIITVNATSNGLSNGDRVKIASAATTGGIPDTEINAEHIIRNKATNTFDIVLTTKATSSVTGGGGASTTYQKPYDTSGLAATAVWSADTFGNLLVYAPGGGGYVYEWSGSSATAGTRITNSPANVNFCFVTQNILVTVYGNTVSWSDQGDRTVWTSAADNLAGSDQIEGTEPFVGFEKTSEGALLFTRSQVWVMRFIGLPYVFSFEKIYDKDGCVGQKASVTLDGIIYWMGFGGIYRYYGGRVEKIPCPFQRYIFESDKVDWTVNADVQYSTALGINPRWGEIWISPLGGYERYAGIVFKPSEGTWWLQGDQQACFAYDRGVYTGYMIAAPYSSDSVILSETNTGTIDFHYDVSVVGTATTNYFPIGNTGTRYVINEVIPDNLAEVGLSDLVINTKDYPQGAIASTYNASSFADGLDKIDVRVSGKLVQYVFSFANGNISTDSASLQGLGNWEHEAISLGSSR